MHLKLDELIRGVKETRNSLIDLEEMSEDELKKLKDEFRTLRTEKPDSSTRGSP